MRGNLTLNLGVRYEYVSPLTEDNNLIANLDLSPGVLNPALPLGATAGEPIQPSPATAESCRPAWCGRIAKLRAADRLCLEAVFRKPWCAADMASTTTRARIKASRNNSRCSRRSRRRRPTSRQLRLTELTLQNGFPAPAAGIITNNYAVNPNYRLGYVQIRNLDIQQQIRPTLLLNIDYTGTKGTNLDILEAPNRTATGIRISEVQAFTYENSVADSEANAGSVRLRKRLAQDSRSAASIRFPSRWMMHLPSAQVRRRRRILLDWARAVRAQAEAVPRRSGRRGECRAESL